MLGIAMAIVLKRSKFEDRPTGIDGAGALGSQVAHVCRYGRLVSGSPVMPMIMAAMMIGVAGPPGM